MCTYEAFGYSFSKPEHDHMQGQSTELALVPTQLMQGDDDPELKLYDLKISMLRDALRNVKGRRHLDFTAVAQDQRFLEEFQERPGILDEEKNHRIHRIAVPITESTSGDGAAPVTTKEVAIDCKLLRIALTGSPSAHMLRSHWPIDESQLPNAVKAALHFALGHPPTVPDNIKYVSPHDDLFEGLGRDAIDDLLDLKKPGRKIAVFQVSQQPHNDKYYKEEKTCVGDLSDGIDPLTCVKVGFHGSFYGNWESILRTGLGHGDIQALRDTGKYAPIINAVFMAPFEWAKYYAKHDTTLNKTAMDVELICNWNEWTGSWEIPFKSMFGERLECIGVVRMVKFENHPYIADINFVEDPNHALLEFLVIRDAR